MEKCANVAQTLEEQFQLANDNFQPKEGGKSFGLTESIQLGEDGSITHYKFQGEETLSKARDNDSPAARGNDSASTKSAEDGVDTVDEDLIAIVKSEVQNELAEEDKEEGLRPKRASAKKARSTIAVLNRLYENNAGIKGKRPKAKDGAEAWTPAGGVEEEEEEEEERPAETRDERLVTPQASTNSLCSITRWDKITKISDIPDVNQDTLLASQVRERIVLRGPVSDFSSKPNLIQCKHCNLKVTNMYILYFHIFSAHPTVLPYQCQECGDYYVTAAELEDHLPVHSLRKTEVVYTVPQFQRRDSILYKCPLANCTSRPLSWSMFNNHMHFHWANDCLLCGEGLVPYEIRTFFDHMSVHITDGPFVCPYCPTLGFRDIASLRYHLCQQHGAGKTPWKCRFCQMMFTSFARFDHHLLKNHSNKPYVCQYCGRERPSIVSLKKHALIHKERGAEHDKIYNHNLVKNISKLKHVPSFMKKYQNCAPEPKSKSPPKVKIDTTADVGKPENVRYTLRNIAPASNADPSAPPAASTTTTRILSPQIIDKQLMTLTSEQEPRRLIYIVHPGERIPNFVSTSGTVNNNLISVLKQPTLTMPSVPAQLAIPQNNLVSVQIPSMTNVLAANLTPSLPTPSKDSLDSLNLKITDVRGAVGNDSRDIFDAESDHGDTETSPIVIAPIPDSSDNSDQTRSEKSSDLKVCPFLHCLAVFTSVTEMWTEHYFPEHFQRTSTYEYMCTKCAALYANSEWPPANHTCKEAWIHICCDCGLLFENQRQKQQHYTHCKGFVPEEAAVRSGTVVDPLTCKYCQKTQDCVKSLCDHVSRHHASHRFFNPLIACEQCTEIRRFLRVDHLWKHYESLHADWWANGGTWLCRICGADHTTEQEINEHLVYSHGRYIQPMMRCPDCFQVFRTKKSLRDHLLDDHEKSGDGQPPDKPSSSSASVDHHPTTTVIAPADLKTNVDHSIQPLDEPLTSAKSLAETNISNVDNHTSRVREIVISNSVKITVEEVVGEQSFEEVLQCGSTESVTSSVLKEEHKEGQEVGIQDLGVKDKNAPTTGPLTFGLKDKREQPDDSEDEDDSGPEFASVCDICDAVIVTFSALRDHVRLLHEPQTRLLACPCIQQPPLSTRKWVHKFWQHCVKEHMEWLRSFQFTCTVCGELFKDKQGFKLHQIYRHRTDVKRVTIEQCVEIVRKMEEARMASKSAKSSLSQEDAHSHIAPTSTASTSGYSTEEKEDKICQPESKGDKKDIIVLSSSDEEEESSPQVQPSVDSSENGKQVEENCPLTVDLDHESRSTKIPSALYKCTQCGKSLPDEASLRKHEKMVHPVGHIKCENCKARMPVDSVNLHVCHSDSDVIAFIPCTFCDQKFQTVAEKNKHIALKHKKQLKRCSQCGKAFISEETLDKHMERMHPSDRLSSIVSKGNSKSNASFSKPTIAKKVKKANETVVPFTTAQAVFNQPEQSNQKKVSVQSKGQARISTLLNMRETNEKPAKPGTVRQLLEESKKNKNQQPSPKSRRGKRGGGTWFSGPGPQRVHKMHSSKCRYCSMVTSSWTSHEEHEQVCPANPDRTFQDSLTSGKKPRGRPRKTAARGSAQRGRQPPRGATKVINIAAPNIAGTDSILEQDLMDMLEEQGEEEEEEILDDAPHSNSQQLNVNKNMEMENESDGDDAAPGTSDDGRILALQRRGDSSDDEDAITAVPVNTEGSESKKTGETDGSNKRRNSSEIFGAVTNKDKLLDEVFGPKRSKTEEAAERQALEEAIFGPQKTSQSVIDEVFGPQSSSSSGPVPSSLFADAVSCTGEINQCHVPVSASGFMEISPIEPGYKNTSQTLEINPMLDINNAVFGPEETSQPLEINPVIEHEREFEQEKGTGSPVVTNVIAPSESVPQPCDPMMIVPTDEPGPSSSCSSGDIQGNNDLPTSEEYRCDVCNETFLLECYLDIHKLNTQHF